MSDIPALPDTERRTEYTGISSSTGPFNVGFQLYGDSNDYVNWLEVWVNGNKKTAVTDWTLSSPSGTLGTIALPITDAQVTFVAAQTGTIEIVGARRPRRTSQVAENRGVTAHDFNQLNSDIIAIARELWDLKTRLLLGPPAEIITGLPKASSRANGLLGFDATGLVPTILSPSTGLGTMTGPATTVPGDVVTWNSSNGTLTADGSATSALAATARKSIFAAPFDAAAYYGLSMNPGHEVSQANEGTSVTINPSVGSVNPYLTDMHRVFAQSASAFTATGQRVAGIFGGFPFVEKITITGTQASPAAADIFHLNHFVEGYRIAKLALGSANAVPFTVVYLVQSSINNHILNISAANAGVENRNWIAKFTLAANTPTMCAFTTTAETSGTWTSTNAAALVTSICLGAGSNYYGTANQWNTGSVQDATSDVTWMPATNGATFQYVGPFIFPGTQVPDITMLPNLVVPFPEAFARCQRYYWKSFLNGTVPAQNVGVGTGEFTFPANQAGANPQKSAVFTLPTRMRLTSPTTQTLYNPAAANAQVRDKTAAADCSASAAAASDQYWFVACTGAAGTLMGAGGVSTLAIHTTLDSRM